MRRVAAFACFIACALVATLSGVQAGQPLPIQAVNSTNLTNTLTLRFNSDTYQFGFNHSDDAEWTPVVTASWAFDEQGWWVAMYELTDHDLVTIGHGTAGYRATGYAQGYIEAQLLWDQWRNASKPTYDRIVLGVGALASDQWKKQLFDRLHQNFFNTTFDDNDRESYDSTVVKLRQLLEGRALGHIQAVADSEAAAAAGRGGWLHHGAESLTVSQLFYLLVEPELLAAEAPARIAAANISYADYTPWMPAPAGSHWTNATAPRFSGHCVVKHVNGDFLVGRVTEAPFDVAMRRVMRTMHIEETVTTTGTAGDYGGSDAWHVTQHTVACGAPIRSVNPMWYSNIGSPADVSQRPTTVARLWAALTAKDSQDFAAKMTHNVLGIDAQSWVIVNIDRPEPFVIVADVAPSDLSAIGAEDDAKGVQSGLWIAGGRPQTTSLVNAFGSTCNTCNVTDTAYGYMYTAASLANLAEVKNTSAMLRQLRATADNWEAAPPHAIVGGSSCAGLAPSPRFDLNPSAAALADLADAAERFADRGCELKAWGGIDAKVASVEGLRSEASSILAIAGPAYEAPNMPGFDPNAYACGTNSTSATYAACVADLGYSHAGPIEFAPLEMPRPRTAAEVDRLHHPMNSSYRLLITVAALTAVLLICGGICMATVPKPVEGPPSTWAPSSQLRSMRSSRLASSAKQPYAPLSEGPRGD